MLRRKALLLVLTCWLLCVAQCLNTTLSVQRTFLLQNAILSVELNGVAPPGQAYPCITQLSIEGVVIVPRIAVGALFQMDVRSSAGDNYNPTQSGACAGDASALVAVQQPWSFIGPTISSSLGMMMGVIPRTFLSSTGACTQGTPTPYYFNFGVQLGDGKLFPQQAMLVEQTFQRTRADAAFVDSLGVEIPTVYYGCNFALYAYYLPTDQLSGGWRPMLHPATKSNYVPGWPVGVGFMVKSYGNMRCNGNQSSSLCAATYTARFNSTAGGMNNAGGGCPANLVPSNLYFIQDQKVYGRLAIFAVGNMGTVSAAMMETASRLKPTDWGNLP